MPEPDQQASAPRKVVENIDAIIRLEEAAMQSRSLGDRVADVIASFIGRVSFIGLHLLVLAIWIAINTRLAPWIPAFDPFPFPLLCAVLSMESVLVAVFVLLKQNRMSYLSDRRSHLDLQINLLTEHEVTRLLQSVGRIEEHLGIAPRGHTEQIAELSAGKEVTHVMDALDNKLANTR